LKLLQDWNQISRGI